MEHPAGGQTPPIEDEQPKRYHVGQIINPQPGFKRVSRRVCFKGWHFDVVREVEDGGLKITKADRLFKPTLQLDRNVFNPKGNKYPLPHQGARECARRRRQAARP